MLWGILVLPKLYRSRGEAVWSMLQSLAWLLQSLSSFCYPHLPEWLPVLPRKSRCVLLLLALHLPQGPLGLSMQAGELTRFRNEQRRRPVCPSTKCRVRACCTLATPRSRCKGPCFETCGPWTQHKCSLGAWGSLSVSGHSPALPLSRLESASRCSR